MLQIPEKALENAMIALIGLDMGGRRRGGRRGRLQPLVLRTPRAGEGGPRAAPRAGHRSGGKRREGVNEQRTRRTVVEIAKKLAKT